MPHPANAHALAAAPPAAPPQVSRWRFALVGALFSLLWSSAFIAGKVGMAASGPLTLLSLRFLLAGLLVWPIARLRAGVSGGAHGVGAAAPPARAASTC